MKIRTSELPVVIDVDETLISKISTTSDLSYPLILNYYGQKVYAKPIVVHIDLLKAYKKRGFEVTIWSANGYQWAQEVITKLSLTEYVDWVATKPNRYVDDKDANYWMSRIFID